MHKWKAGGLQYKGALGKHQHLLIQDWDTNLNMHKLINSLKQVGVLQTYVAAKLCIAVGEILFSWANEMFAYVQKMYSWQLQIVVWF